MKGRSLLFAIPIYLAFFASGAASLAAEVTWNRMLIVVVGNSMAAAALIIAVFMGGLGLGSWIGGRFFGHRRPSLLPYVGLELLIGAYVLLSPALFGAFDGLFRSMAASMDQGALTLVRVLVTVAALALPATLMGATFPAIVSGTIAGAPGKGTARTGYLYSTNTLGAAIGCFAAGYHLLLEFGVQFTLNVAFGLYVLAALSGLLAHSVRRRSSAPASAEPAADAGPAPRRLPVYLPLAVMAVGFVALAYEVLLTRIAILYLGNSVSVFPLVLTGFLLGTGFSAIAGTWLYGSLRRAGRRAELLFGWLAAGAAILVVATPYLLLSDRIVPPEHFQQLQDAAPRNPLPILLLIIAPTVLIGALLPIAIRIADGDRRAGTTLIAARLYAMNTAGGVAGAAVANHWLVPWIGVQGTLGVLAGICLAVTLAQFAERRGTGARAGLALAGAAAAAWIVMGPLPDIIDRYATKIAQSTGAASTEIHLLREGRAATVTVLDQDDPRMGSYRDLYLNGVEEASTRYWHAQLFKLLGVLPGLIHESDEPKDALVIAFGAGITAGSVLAADDVRSLDVVDLNPDVREINELFAEANGDLFDDPRFEFHNDDGRNYLVTTNRRYDLIIGDSTHPRAYDSWILYTREFYEDAKSKLKPGGVFAQWVPVLTSMRGDLMRIHLNTFRDVFPHATLWYIYGSDQAFLMATEEPFRLDPARVEPRVEALADWFAREHYQIDTVNRLAAFLWLDEDAMARMIGGETRLNHDDRHYFSKQSAVRPHPPQFQLPFFQADAAVHVVGADEAMRAEIHAEQAVGQHLARYVFYGSREDLDAAYCANPESGNARWFLRREFAGEIPEAEDYCLRRDIERYRRSVASHPDNALALNALADRLTEAGELAEARELAQRAVTLEPKNGMILDTYGWVLHRLGETETARDVLRRAAEQLPDHPIVLYHLGAVESALGARRSAEDRLRQALASPVPFPQSEDARRLLEGLAR